MLLRMLLRHVLPIGLVAALVFVAWVVVTIPIIAVFVVDDAFEVSQYLGFLANASLTSLGLSALVLFPVALFGEALAKRSKHVVWLFPIMLCLAAGSVVTLRLAIFRSLREAFLSWSGLLGLLAALFVLYWAVLWLEAAVAYAWHELWAYRRRQTTQRTVAVQGQ